MDCLLNEMSVVPVLLGGIYIEPLFLMMMMIRVMIMMMIGRMMLIIMW